MNTKEQEELKKICKRVINNTYSKKLEVKLLFFSPENQTEFGQYLYNQKIIRINSNLPFFAGLEVLAHELVHAVLWQIHKINHRKHPKKGIKIYWRILKEIERVIS
jgi:Zn-dependent peptidase ImmA (M78 family)